MHDSQKFIDVLSENTSQDAYVDSAYGGEEYELTLKALGVRLQTPHHQKGIGKQAADCA